MHEIRTKYLKRSFCARIKKKCFSFTLYVCTHLYEDLCSESRYVHLEDDIIVILVYIIYLPLSETCLRAECIGERAKRRVSIIMKFQKRPARRKGASPGDNDLCHLCCCEDGGRVDNLCQHQDRYSSSWHLGRRELVSELSAAASPAFGISLFCSGTKPTKTDEMA